MTRFDTEIKGRTRERGVRFFKGIASRLEKRPADIKAFCFPYTSPTQALEVTDVFDMCGVKRSNITGFELVEERFDFLNRQDLKISLNYGDCEEYFATTQDRFDWISLDFEGQLSSKVIRILKSIAGRQILSPKGILALNVYGKRESYEARTHYRMADEDIVDDNLLSLWLKNRGRKKINRWDIIGNAEHLRLYKQFRREVGITKLVASTMLRGRENLDTPCIRLNTPGVTIDGEDKEIVLGIADAEKRMRTQGIDSRYLEIMRIASAARYFTMRHECYRYTTPNKSNMFMDLFYLDQANNVIASYHPVSAERHGNDIYFRMAEGSDNSQPNGILRYFEFLEERTRTLLPTRMSLNHI